MIDAREYLHSFRIADSKIQLKIQQVQKLNDRLSSVSTVSGAITMFFRPTVEDTVGEAAGVLAIMIYLQFIGS